MSSFFIIIRKIAISFSYPEMIHCLATITCKATWGISQQKVPELKRYTDALPFYCHSCFCWLSFAEKHSATLTELSRGQSRLVSFYSPFSPSVYNQQKVHSFKKALLQSEDITSGFFFQHLTLESKLFLKFIP